MPIIHNNLPDIGKEKPPSISKATIKKKGLANEFHSDCDFSAFCTNSPCILGIFKKQGDKSKQIWQHLPWQFSCLLMAQPHPD